MSTHWALPFGRFNPRRQLEAACGVFIDPKLHTTEPTCPACQRYLAADQTLEAALDATFAEDSEQESIQRDPRR